MSTPFTLVLARRFLRGRRARYGAGVVVVVVAFLVGSYVTLHALSLTTSQRVEQQLGDAAASADFGGLIPDVPPGRVGDAAAVMTAARDAGLAHVVFELNALDVPVATAQARRLSYVEREWSRSPLLRRYELVGGRWPRTPGEVVVSNPHGTGAKAHGRLPLFSGRVAVEVVGLARDVYSDAAQLLAAPGTWAEFDTTVNADFPTALATARVYTRSSDEAKLTALLSSVAPADDDGQSAQAFSSSVVTANVLSRTANAVWFGRLPSAYRVPSIVLPFLAVLLFFGVHQSWLRQRLAALTDSGVRRAVGVRALMAALLAILIVAVTAGTVVGFCLALSVRPVLSAVHTQPLSSPVSPLMPAVTALGMTVAAWLVVFLAVQRGSLGRRGSATRLRRPSDRWRDARHLAAVAATCVAVVLVAEIQTASDTMILAAAVAVAGLLSAPELVRWGVGSMRERTPVRRLARRQLIADRARLTMSVAVIAGTLGLPLGFLTLLDTTLATDRTDNVPDVQPGRLYLSSVSGTLHPPSASVQRVAERALGPDRSSTDLRSLIADGGDTFATSPDLDDTFVLAFDHVGDIEKLLDVRLGTAERSVLTEGGMLAWDSTAPEVRLALFAGGSTRPSRVVDLPSRGVPRPAVGWVKGTQGIVLSATATAHGLPLTRGARFYAGVPLDQAERARDAVFDAKLDPEQVTTYKPPDPVVPALAQGAVALALALLVLGVAGTMARAQVGTLRPYVATLNAIGVAPGWTRRVLFLQQGLMLALATVLSLLIAAPPVLAAAAVVPDVVLSVPVASLLALVAGVYGVSFGVTSVAARSIRR